LSQIVWVYFLLRLNNSNTVS